MFSVTGWVGAVSEVADTGAVYDGGLAVTNASYKTELSWARGKGLKSNASYQTELFWARGKGLESNALDPHTWDF